MEVAIFVAFPVTLGMIFSVIFSVTGRAIKGEENQTKYVERGQSGGQKAETVQHRLRAGPRECGLEDFILAEKAGKAGSSRNRQSGDEHRAVSPGNALAQTAHL